MTSRTDHSWRDVEPDDADEAEPERGWFARILIVVLLAGTGSGSAFIWQAAGGSLSSLIPQSLMSTTSPAAVAEKPAARSEIDALRQQLTSLNQSNQQLLAAQQAEIKRLTDHVATLSGKLDLLQRPVTSAQGAIPSAKPAVAPAPATAKKKPEAAKPVAAAKPEPKPVDSRPTGAISTGGAPLQLSR